MCARGVEGEIRWGVCRERGGEKGESFRSMIQWSCFQENSCHDVPEFIHSFISFSKHLLNICYVQGAGYIVLNNEDIALTLKELIG